jgi:hypothetical protein
MAAVVVTIYKRVHETTQRATQKATQKAAHEATNSPVLWAVFAPWPTRAKADSSQATRLQQLAPLALRCG